MEPSSSATRGPIPVAPALAEIVERVRELGCRFVAVDELDTPADLSPIASPRPPGGGHHDVGVRVYPYIRVPHILWYESGSVPPVV